MLQQIGKLVLALLVLASSLYAQGNVAFNWTHSWGGSGNESGGAIATDTLSNVYVVGSTNSFGAGGQDVLLIKYDSLGNPQWQKTWGGPSDEFATGIVVDANGFIYVVGGTQSFGAGWFDVLILKFDTGGNFIWAHTWGGGSYDAGYDVSFDQYGNLAIAAESYSFGSCAVLLTFSTGGAFLGSHTWKGPATFDSAYSITVDTNGNQVLTGISWNYSVFPNRNSILAIKYDSQGNFLWSRTWAGPSEDEAWGTKVVRTDTQGNIYIAGRTSVSCNNPNFGLCDFDVVLLKIDPAGTLLWAQKWGGTGWDTATALWLDSSNNLIVVGSTASFFSGVRAALIQKYDNAGGDPLVSKVFATSAASGWSSIVGFSPTMYVATGDAPSESGVWQDTGISAVTAVGSLASPQFSLSTPTGTLGTAVGTTGSPVGINDSGAGGADVVTAVFSFSHVSPTTHTLNVASTNPGSGVGIIVSPSDNDGQNNGATPFSRNYDDGIVVSLSAPTIVNGNSFAGWTGCDSTSGVACTVTENADRAVTANYLTPLPTSFRPDLFVNGKKLSGQELTNIIFVATYVVPQLWGDRLRQISVASRSSWWGLKEGTFSLNNPHIFSVCSELQPNGTSKDVRLKSLEICQAGRAWQVGLAAVQVPNFTDQIVLDTVNMLWPNRPLTDVLAEAAQLAGFDPTTGTGAAIVASSGVLRKSWLLRHPVVGLTLVERDVTVECIQGAAPYCYGTGWPQTRNYAATRNDALMSINDLAGIFASLSP